MNRLRMMKAVVTVALVLGALSYGGHAAIAGARTPNCLYSPPAFLGECPAGGSSECDQMCKEAGPDWMGYCTGGGANCCVCFM
jgi:hypothetical protein